MGYRDLVDKGANRAKIPNYLVQDEIDATIIRAPDNLKATIMGEALLSGMSISAYIRQRTIQRFMIGVGVTK
jgi:hypothetical protein